MPAEYYQLLGTSLGVPFFLRWLPFGVPFFQCSVMTNLYASVSTAKPAPLASTVSELSFSATLITVAISVRDCFII